MLGKTSTGNNLFQSVSVYTIIFKSEILVAPLPACDQNGKHSDPNAIVIVQIIVT